MMYKYSKQFDVPILFVIFRRKDEALSVIAAISKVKPSKLYISQDGPRNEKEKKEILATQKAVLSKINWKCKLTLWAHSENLGLKKHVPYALDRFFEKEEYGIYLEDDTVPSMDFFYFQKELLNKYKNNTKIFSINGTNFYPELVNVDGSYYFSKLGDIWGMGIWKRSWKLYKSKIEDLDIISNKKDYKKIFINLKHKFYLETFWNAVINNKLDSWAMQLVYAALKNNMLFISPSVNMVNNIGKNSSGSNIAIQEYHKEFNTPFPLRHPKNLEYDNKNDSVYFDNMLRGGWLRLVLIRIYLSLPLNLKLAINKLTSNIYRG